MPSDTAKKYLKNNPGKQDRFDEIFNDLRIDMKFDSAVSETLRQLREEAKKNAGGTSYSTGGEVEIKKGGDYIKDLL
jgi:hypothetical protein|tara:strand:+ start:473 stop:703 length:231 start_codon:yes stop_codon:yes gene_type:complete